MRNQRDIHEKSTCKNLKAKTLYGRENIEKAAGQKPLVLLVSLLVNFIVAISDLEYILMYFLLYELN
jgi:hypothetical protein